MCGMAKFEPAMEHTFGAEGGYADDPADHGGPTNMGVTLATLRAALGADVDGDGFLDGDFDRDGDIDAEDVKRLPRAVAKERVYRPRYWDRPGFGWIRDQRVATKAFDLGVHAGPRAAILLLQRAVNHALASFLPQLRLDGALGPKTLMAIDRSDPAVLLAAFASVQASFYLRIIAEDPTQLRFKKNWLARARWPLSKTGELVT